MISTQETNELGVIKIHNNVIASVAYLAALEVDGVGRICDNIKSQILSAIGKKTRCGAIDVRRDKDDHMTIVVPMIVKYGYNIPQVATKVQDQVKAAVEESTDLSPKEVIIKIKGVER